MCVPEVGRLIVWGSCAWVAAWVAVGCSPKVYTVRYHLPPEYAAAANTRPASCPGWENYVPDRRFPHHLPMRYLRVNVHILDNGSGTAHRHPDSARHFARELIRLANAALDTNVVNWRSPQGTAALPKRYRYVLTPQSGRAGDEGVYYHYDDDLYFFVSRGKNQNNYTRDVIERYAVGGDSIVNIFLLVHHPDSVASPTYKADGQGIALGMSVKIAGALERPFGPEASVGLLNHEIGHVLGLSHAWMYDGCPDTDDHPNKCWEWNPEPPCRDQATNNMMDYNAYQIALTPCQIGKIHALLSDERAAIRRYLVPTWCSYHPEQTLIISDTVVWKGDRDLSGDLIIAAGGHLRLSCRLSLPPGGRIVVQPGGVLWLDGCYLHNACGQMWEGIFVQHNKKDYGQVRLLKPPLLSSVRPQPTKQARRPTAGL